MVHSLGEPELLLPLVCLVQRVHHPCGYEIVGIAMDEEHGSGALCHLPEGTCLGKVPSIHGVAKQGCDVQQGEGRKRELVGKLTPELVPCTGVTAILHEVGYVRGQVLLARKHHCGSRTHGNAVHHHRGVE